MKPIDLIPTRWLETVGLTTQAQAQRAAESKAARAYEGGYYDGLNGNDEPASGDLKSYGYRTSGNRGKRDFTKLTQDRLIEIAWVLYQSNPLATRYLQIIRDHVLGRGVEQAIEDEALRKVVKTFWERNKLDERLQEFTVQLRLFGEQCFPAFVRKADGRVTLGYIDPAEIEHVVTHPQNVLEKYAVVLKTDSTYGRRIYRIIRKDEGFTRGSRVIAPKYDNKMITWEQAKELEPWETIFLQANGLQEYSGSCFYFSINNVSNQPRGFSDLLQVSDWLDAGDETLFALADREQMAGYFSWLVKLIGVGYDELMEKAAAIRKRIPKKGQVLVTNDKEEWSMQAPDLKQQASISTFDAIRDWVWGLLGLPKTWLGIGEDSNRASALVMNGPTHRTLENKQDVIKRMVLEILCFVRDQAEIAGAWKPKGEDAGQIDLTMPEMAKADMAQVSTTLSGISQAMAVIHQDLGLVTKLTVAKVIAKALSEMGIEYDPAKELEAAEKEQEEAEEEDDELSAGDAANKFLAQQLKMKQMANGNGAMMDDEEMEEE
jgi:hypothetical protein